jgi:hypothetical protein
MSLLTKILFAAVLTVSISSAFADIQDRHLTGFNGVNVGGSFDVRITQGSSESVKVEAPAEMMDKIITEVQGGILKIYNKRDFNFNWKDWFGGNNHHKVIVYVAAKNINEITVSGSGDVFFKDGLTGNNMKIKVSGSGDVFGKVEVKSLEAGISGSGDMRLSGHAQTSTISVTGSGDFSGHDLITSTTSVRVSGSGDASVYVNDRLDAAVSGSGDVRYAGNAKNVSTAKSGSGEIHRN